MLPEGVTHAASPGAVLGTNPRNKYSEAQRSSDHCQHQPARSTDDFSKCLTPGNSAESYLLVRMTLNGIG